MVCPYIHSNIYSNILYNICIPLSRVVEEGWTLWRLQVADAAFAALEASRSRALQANIISYACKPISYHTHVSFQFFHVIEILNNNGKFQIKRHVYIEVMIYNDLMP